MAHVMNESDRRKMERFDLRLPTKLFWEGEDKEQKSIELMTSNVCAGGAYLMTNRPLPKGTRVKVNLTLQSDRPHEIKARLSLVDVLGDVIRTNHQGMAIRFDREYTILPH